MCERLKIFKFKIQQLISFTTKSAETLLPFDSQGWYPRCLLPTPCPIRVNGQLSAQGHLDSMCLDMVACLLTKESTLWVIWCLEEEIRCVLIDGGLQELTDHARHSSALYVTLISPHIFQVVFDFTPMSLKNPSLYSGEIKEKAPKDSISLRVAWLNSLCLIWSLDFCPVSTHPLKVSANTWRLSNWGQGKRHKVFLRAGFCILL